MTDIDGTIQKFIGIAKKMNEENKITCPVAIITYRGINGEQSGAAYARFEGVGAAEVAAIGDGLRTIRQRMIAENKEPVAIMFTIVGSYLDKTSSPEERERFAEQFAREIKGDYRDSFLERNSLLVVVHDSSGDTRSFVATFERPPDGGVVYYKEHYNPKEKHVTLGASDLIGLLSNTFKENG